MRPGKVFVVLVALCLCGAYEKDAWLVSAQSGWETSIHKPGYCALKGTCGFNERGAVPCALNSPATPLDDNMRKALGQYCPHLWQEMKEQDAACCNLRDIKILSGQTSLAKGLLGGCPACFSNFVNLWCTISCSPNQATFVNVTKVKPGMQSGFAADEADMFLSEEYKNALFDSCKDVKFGAANLRSMQFFNNPQNADEWLQFLGNRSEKAPYQIHFPDVTPEEMTPVDTEIPGCDSPDLRCSCADCESANYCIQVPAPGPPDDNKNRAWLIWSIEGFYAIVIMVLAVLVFQKMRLESKNKAKEEVAPLLPKESSLQDEVPQEEEALITEGPVAAQVSKVDGALAGFFHKQGRVIAKWPVLVTLTSLLLLTLCGAGLIWFQIEEDPQGLWTPKHSRSVYEQKEFIESFGPFFRIDTMVLSTKEDPETGMKPPIVTKENINLLFNMTDVIYNITGYVRGDEGTKPVRLSDVCFKPMKNSCAIQSVLQYWQLNRTTWDTTVAEHKGAQEAAEFCFDHWTTPGLPHLHVSCISNFSAPIDPKTVLGGYPKGSNGAKAYATNSTAFVVTFPLNSAEETREEALAWEAAFVTAGKHTLKDMAESHNLTLSFLTERSVQDELKRESSTDVLTIGISYLVMLLYVAMALSWRSRKWTAWWERLVHSRLFLAFGGVLIVGGAVVGAMGLCSWMGVKATLIIMEVIPFLVLAVGVDNIFILVHALERQDEELELEERIGRALAESGPSICLAASAEAVAFALGIIIPVPAVRSFALCAFFAIVLDFILQMTIFVALMALDTSRSKSNRLECVPCYQMHVAVEEESGNSPSGDNARKSLLQLYVSHVHVPILLGQRVVGKVIRCIVLFGTITLAFFFAYMATKLSRGLEQQVALPKDSYLQDFFNDGMESLRVGPPLLIVVKNMNISKASEDVNKVCAISGCNTDSLVSQISLAQTSGAYHLASPASSWIDDFLMWSQLPNCCQYNPTSRTFCDSSSNSQQDCTPCDVDITGKRPTVEQFQEFMPWFMETTPSKECARGGSGAYDTSIQHEQGDPTNITGLDEGLISAAYFRAYYEPLLSQSDFITTLEDTRDFIDKMSKNLGLEIYGYSTFHVFFESYLTITYYAIGIITAALIGGFLVCWLFIANAWTSLLVMFAVMLTMVDLMGVMSVWGVHLNGVSVVNLVMSVGIAMEFCIHIARSFMTFHGSNEERMAASLEGVGSAVISGITLTKFAGVVVLAFSRTQIFEIYFFRMYFSLVLLGAWHGLVFLPVLFVLFGSQQPRKIEG